MRNADGGGRRQSGEALSYLFYKIAGATRSVAPETVTVSRRYVYVKEHQCVMQGFFAVNLTQIQQKSTTMSKRVWVAGFNFYAELGML